MIRGCLIYLQGLGGSLTTGDWCGAKPHAERLALKHGLTLIPGVYNDAAVKLVVDKAREDGFYFVALGGHSHGGDEAGDIAERYGPEAIDVVFFIDKCPELEADDLLAPIETYLPPQDFPAAARFAYANWQRNDGVLRGVAFKPRDGAYVDDATGWKDPKVGHVAIAGDARTWARIDTVIGMARFAREYTPPAAPPPGPALCAADVGTGTAPPDAPASHDDAGAPTAQGGT